MISLCKPVKHWSRPLSSDLTEAFLEAGLIQFGRFDSHPFKLNLELLPSYPDLLVRVAAALQPHIGSVERLLATFDAVSLGAVLATQAAIPLVYSRGTQQPAVQDLVGAYDVGHPTALITLVWWDDPQIGAFTERARRVGLDVRTVVTVIDCTRRSTAVHSLLRLEGLVAQLVVEGRLRSNFGQSIIQHLR
jgi:hypothetical protein